MSVATVTIVAELSKYIEDISKLPGFTEKKVGEAAARMERVLVQRHVRASKEAEKAAVDLAKKALDGENALKNLGDAFKKLDGVAGGGFKAIGGPLGDLSDLLEYVDRRVVAVGVAFTVATGAIAGAVTGTIAMARGMDELEAEARRLSVTIEDGQVAALRKLESALMGVDAQVLNVRVDLASALAPAITRVTDAFAGLVSIVGGGTAALSTSDGSTVAGALSAGAKAVSMLVLGTGGSATLDMLADALGFATGKLEDFGRASRESMQREASALADFAAAEQRTTEMRLDAARAALKAREEAEREAERRAKEAQREAERRAKEAAEAVKRLSEIEMAAYASTLDAYDKIEVARNAQLASIAELEATSGDHALAETARAAVMADAQRGLAAAREEAARRGMAAADAYERQRAQIAEQEQRDAERRAAEMARAMEEQARLREEAIRTAQAAAASAMSSVGSVVSAVSAATSAVIESYDTSTEAGRQAARQGFAAMKVFALADVALKTAQAIMNAFTFPTPVGVALGVAAASAAGAVQAGIIAAQQPTFHAGYMPAAMQGDEVIARVKRNEMVIPSPTVVAAGGPQEVRRRVEGEGAGAPVMLVADFGDGPVMVRLRRAVGRRATIGSTGHWGG